MLLVNISELMGPDWRFIEPRWRDPAVKWAFFVGQTRPGPQPRWRQKLTTLHATLAAQRAAGHAERAVLVSHLPATAVRINPLRRLLTPETPQIAFAFNYTALPRGARGALHRAALAGIDEFVVFSRMERQLYSRHFGLPAERFRMLPWAMDPPVPAPRAPLGAGYGPYLCAIGGEARDYSTLAAAMRRLPHLTMVIVARGRSLAGIDIPPNVRVFTDLAPAETWRLAVDSLGLAVPLRSADTACGHITIVGAQLLGIPLVVTDSAGVADYVGPDTAALVPVGSSAALAHALAGVVADRDGAFERAAAAKARAEAENGLDRWVAYFEAAVRRYS